MIKSLVYKFKLISRNDFCISKPIKKQFNGNEMNWNKKLKKKKR